VESDIIGINNRDLKTFEVDLAVTERLRPLIPMDKCVAALSGIHTRADAERMLKAGVHAILVAESLMLAPDLPTKMRELLI
jgi:indole-3-glycerol phosphate synthase